MFGFYMKNLPFEVKSPSINSYADDAMVYLSFSSENTDSCLAKIIEDLRQIAGRSCSKQLMFCTLSQSLGHYANDLTSPLLRTFRSSTYFLNPTFSYFNSSCL